MKDDDPRWTMHSGKQAHDGPQWSHADVDQLVPLVAGSPPKLRSFLRLLADHPGDEFEAEALAEHLEVKGGAGVAGVLSPFNKWRGSGRAFPFTWWENGDGPTTYAMRPSVATAVRAALREVEG